MAKQGKKRGPKPKIGPKEEAEILACLTVGASLRDCADYIGVDYKTLYNQRKKDTKFSNRLRQAVKKGKIHHLNKIGRAPQWQASAFMLERKWWREYGRKDKVQAEHTGANGGPIQTTVDVRSAVGAMLSDPQAREHARLMRERMRGLQNGSAD